MTAAVAHAVAPAAAAPCPQPPRAAAEARPRTGGGQRVRVPLRLVVGAQYADAALSVYIKIAALAMRPENCLAKVATIAEYLGLSKSSVERALTQLTTAGSDGIAEVITVRHTSRDGEGESAERWVRTMDENELFVWLPARAATSLPPRQLRLYAAISYAQVRRMPLTLAELRAVVRHQYGDSAGQPLGERQVMRLLDELETSGWITIHRRQGPRGRHAYEAHLRPLHPVQDNAPKEPATATPDIHDGSAPRTADGSLATEEDRRTDRPLTSAGVGCGIRRRRDAGSSRAAGHGERRSNSGGAAPAAYTGPGLQLSPRVWTVLEPVRHELQGIRAYVLRRIGHEIGRQLSAGAGAERLTARLTRRWATTDAPHRGDVGRWILGAGLPRRGCGLAACEDGITWHTGDRCPICHDNQMHALQAAAGAQQQDVVQEQPPEPPPRPTPVAWVAVPAPAVSDCPPVPDAAGRAELRAAATPDTVRQAIADHGRAQATYLYGHALVLPHLAELDPDPEGTPA
ncbi:helix-turn-helix domain-containing protein [Streptomyces sp. NPDC001515]